MPGVGCPVDGLYRRDHPDRIACARGNHDRTNRLVPIVACGLLSAAVAADGLDEQEFRRLHKELRPAADELWRSIGWKISLLDAQRVAARQQKPIFIWAMDGHPLGCT